MNYPLINKKRERKSVAPMKQAADNTSVSKPVIMKKPVERPMAYMKTLERIERIPAMKLKKTFKKKSK